MRSYSIAAACVAGWVVYAAACTPKLGDEGTAAAAAVSVGTGAGNAGAAGGAGGAGGVGGGGGDGGNGGVHGCLPANAVDRTGLATVLINDVSVWQIPHTACVRVDAGTVVRWEGNFALHPLVGGEQPTEDATSPIAGHTVMNDGTTDFVEVTFPNGGDYPYFCDNHAASMNGVVFVEGGGGAGGTGGTGGAPGGNGGNGGDGGN